MFQSYLDSEFWRMIFSGVDFANAWAFLGWIITGNVQRDVAIVEVVHMARSWGWECKGPCMIKLTQYSSWRWWYLKSFAALAHHQNRFVIIETQRRNMSPISHFGIPELFNFFTTVFRAPWLVMLFSGHKSIRGEFSFHNAVDCVFPHWRFLEPYVWNRFIDHREVKRASGFHFLGTFL